MSGNWGGSSTSKARVIERLGKAAEIKKLFSFKELQFPGVSAPELHVRGVYFA
jgi:hypothetical protein